MQPDEEETDWGNDPFASAITYIEGHLSGLLRATNEWFRIYKIPGGGPENHFAFSGECKIKK